MVEDPEHKCDGCDDYIKECWCRDCREGGESDAYEEGKKEGHNEGYEEARKEFDK